MSQEYGRWIPIAKNGDQLGFWADNSLGITRGGVVGVKTDEGSFLSVGTQGLTAVVDGDTATVTTGSPRRLVVPNPNTLTIRALASQVSTQATEIDTKAAQTDLDALAATTADFDTAGLARKVEDPGEVTIDTGDVPGSLGALRDAINALRTAMSNADLMGTR